MRQAGPAHDRRGARRQLRHQFGDRLGAYLKDRRVKLDPAALGFPAQRRRTPGLRREEVAQRAHISPTWYTWLEQGRGGAPSADVLERIAHALMLTDAEREHLFLLGLGRPPDARYRQSEGVTPRLQRVLDALDPSPAIIRTATWDVVAWNRAATVMLTDYGALPPAQRNILRSIFLDPKAARCSTTGTASRASCSARSGWTRRAPAPAPRCSRSSTNSAGSAPSSRPCGTTTRSAARMARPSSTSVHPTLGPIAFEFSTFAVDGRTDLNMVVYNPATPADAKKIRIMIEAQHANAGR
jgi:transcriptional regulator with XRE-family HTH domain